MKVESTFAIFLAPLEPTESLPPSVPPGYGRTSVVQRQAFSVVVTVHRTHQQIFAPESQLGTLALQIRLPHVHVLVSAPKFQALLAFEYSPNVYGELSPFP